VSHHGRAVRVLDLEPIPRRAGAVGRAHSLRHYTLVPEHRGLTPITSTKCAYDLLARNGWQAEAESDIVSDGGCGSVAGRVQGGLNTHSLREFNALLTSIS
jgi:hypothetical protein